MPNNIENESKVIPMKSVSTEPTAERLPSKKTRFSAKKELQNLKKEFEDYKARVERDFQDIDQNLEENFTKLYEQLDNVHRKIPSQDQIPQIESALERLTKIVNKKDTHNFKSVLSTARRVIPKKLQDTLNPAQIAVAKYVSTNFDSEKKNEKDAADKDDDGKSPFEKSPGLLKRITDKLKETDGKMSAKDILSTAGKETKSYAKDVFDPLNIARFLTFDSDIAPTVLGKLTGRSKEDIGKFTSGPSKDKKETASKISGGMDKEYEAMTNVLTDIYDLMKKSRDDDIKQKELDKDFEKPRRDDQQKKHKELIEAIRSIGTGAVGAEKEKEEGGGILGTLADAASLMGGSKKLKSLRGKVTKSASKMGGKLLKAGKSVLGFLERIPGIQLIAAGLQLLMDVKDAIDEHESGAIDEKEMKKRITEAVGGALGGAGGATIGAAVGSVVPVVGTLLGGLAGFMGGEYIGKKAAGALFDFFEGGADPDQAARKAETATPKTTKESMSTSISGAGGQEMSRQMSNSMSSQPTPGGASSGGGSASPSASPSAAPAPSPNKGAELNSKVSENQNMKLAENTPSEPSVINNTSSSSSSSGGSERQPIPPVRSKEDTFSRLSMYSTRTV